MRGAFLHNHIVTHMAVAFRQAGTEVRCECPVRCGRHPGFVDLFVCWGAGRIVCEVERSPRRVDRDIAKALALDADLLLLVVPTGRVEAAVKREVRRASGEFPAPLPPILVRRLLPALQQITNKSLLMSVSYVNRQQTSNSPKTSHIKEPHAD